MRCLVLSLALLNIATAYGQAYYIGFQTLKLKDSRRICKPGTPADDSLHYKLMELDIWYPSVEKVSKPMTFEDLFRLLEERAVLYPNEETCEGMAQKLAQFYVAELGVGSDRQKLYGIATKSYSDLDSEYPEVRAGIQTLADVIREDLGDTLKNKTGTGTRLPGSVSEIPK